MRRIFTCLLFAFATAAAEIQVIPRPVDVRETDTRLHLTKGATVQLADTKTKDLVLATLSEAAGFPLVPALASKPGSIQFLPATTLPDRIPVPKGEGYVIRITGEGANVHAATPAGHFHGLQTLAQLIRSGERDGQGAISLGGAQILDAPRFAWRGFMLDESRHFTGEAGVKRLLDGMARYKLNRLHWHLTDSAGWRIEIKKYPKLTTIGGRGNESDRSADAPAQFYTQEQIRGIVAYAKERHITIVPEIDMPGHADAAVLAYPEHDGGGFLQKGNKDKWPHFTFNPAKKETLSFLDDILKEVAALFPEAGVIHVGGDEVHFGWHEWPKLQEVQALMKKERLKDLAAVETWFIRRMSMTINGLRFQTGGWDEIASRDLPRDKSLVFWWRHDKPQVLHDALKNDYSVVLCPRRPCYFDFVQHDSHKVGRRWGGFNPLSEVYAFPAALKLSAADEKQVRGIQACLWTETAVTQARRDFLIWPRLVALAEAAWTPDSRKDFSTFEQRLPAEIEWLRAKGIKPYDPSANSPEIGDLGAKPEYPDKAE
ncbi:beta-N-acetylhexosaminidase [Luteolibacter arcticus]|uniref:beta-N-acetylhexosaminidase n=1 Tax=Luteolibacter arcticus TaxID=1581411 RepID=A0ABT3GMR0_9BACT|nr:beta-N-acetylhexosaminidase [Luteolibacter arcticus]MCW1924809.1 beta-N-acetylhexosaminidase [Luteolibacter arcticus]